MITEQLTPLLLARKEKLKGITKPHVQFWASGKTSPLLKNVDRICKENDLKVLVYDGNLDALIRFAHDVAKEQGLKMVLNFEV
jgi:hypothetical protein